MHIEKNVCDCFISTLLNMLGKTKNTVKTRLDLVEMCVREKLTPEKRGQNIYLSLVCHTLSKKKKI